MWKTLLTCCGGIRELSCAKKLSRELSKLPPIPDEGMSYSPFTLRLLTHDQVLPSRLPRWTSRHFARRSPSNTQHSPHRRHPMIFRLLYRPLFRHPSSRKRTHQYLFATIMTMMMLNQMSPACRIIPRCLSLPVNRVAPSVQGHSHRRLPPVRHLLRSQRSNSSKLTRIGLSSFRFHV